MDLYLTIPTHAHEYILFLVTIQDIIISLHAMYAIHATSTCRKYVKSDYPIITLTSNSLDIKNKTM